MVLNAYRDMDLSRDWVYIKVAMLVNTILI